MHKQTRSKTHLPVQWLAGKFVLGVSLLTLFTLTQCTPPANLAWLAEYREAARAEFDVHSVLEPLEGFPVFELNNDYPQTSPEPEDWPWLNYDFQTEPEEYIQAVLGYALEGNVDYAADPGAADVDWRVQDNPVRQWYHAPWMHLGNNPREPIHGLTRERGSRLHELSPQQTRRTRNWAVGFYNPTGAYTLGQVWKNPGYPDSTAARFADGTVAIKLLFTDATDDEAPYLASEAGLLWHVLVNSGRPPVPMRLLQFDIAVRDARADAFTGWVFGTFVFDGREEGEHYWDNLVPVGLQWGNDPALTYEKYRAGERPTQGWLNPSVAQMMQHRLPDGDLGYLGRVNGPIDNPLSGCLACHSRAMDTQGERAPSFTPRLADLCVVVENVPQLRNEQYVRISAPDCEVSADAEMRIGEYFRNLSPSEPFWEAYLPLDYSLQLAVGIANWADWKAEEFPDIELMMFRVQFDPESGDEVGTAEEDGLLESELQLEPMDAFSRGD